MLTSSPLHQSPVDKNTFLTKLKKIIYKPLSHTLETKFNFLNLHQIAPTNPQSQRGLKSNDCNIPAGGRYKKMIYILVYKKLCHFKITI